MIGYSILIYGFPLYLVLFEALFRGLFQLDATSFIGPALAAAGLSILFPLTRPKSIELTPALAKRFEEQGISAVSKRDQFFIAVTWLIVLLGLIVWLWACSVSIQKPNEEYWLVPYHIWIGLLNYSVAIIFTLVKEKI